MIHQTGCMFCLNSAPATKSPFKSRRRRAGSCHYGQWLFVAVWDDVLPGLCGPVWSSVVQSLCSVLIINPCLAVWCARRATEYVSVSFNYPPTTARQLNVSPLGWTDLKGWRIYYNVTSHLTPHSSPPGWRSFHQDICFCQLCQGFSHWLLGNVIAVDSGQYSVFIVYGQVSECHSVTVSGIIR